MVLTVSIFMGTKELAWLKNIPRHMVVAGEGRERLQREGGEKNLWFFFFFLFIHTGGCKLPYSKSLTISRTVLFLKLIIDLDLG